MPLFHITTREDWDRALATGEHRPVSLVAEGFVHLSHPHQWRGALDRFFRGRRDLVLLSIHADRLRCEVREEEADGDRFPHLYGPLNTDAVFDVVALP